MQREGSSGEQNYRVVISVTPGKPVIVDKVEVKVTGPGADDPVFASITNDLPIQSGDRLSHTNYETLKGGLLRAAATYGYLDARMLRNEMRVDPQLYTCGRRHRNSKPASVTAWQERPSGGRSR